MSSEPLATAEPDSGPLGSLPCVGRYETRLGAWLGRLEPRLRAALAWLVEPIGLEPAIGPAEIVPSAAGLGRPGVIAQLTWSSRAARIGLGIETPLAHALVDRLLGFERPPGAERLQVTPVEWGILTLVVARTLDQLDLPGASDLVIDRVGPDPFRADRLGSILTVRWPVRVGGIAGSIRLWLSESLVNTVDLVDRVPAGGWPVPGRLAGLMSDWRAEAGTVTLSRGTSLIRVGSVLMLGGSPLRGSRENPSGRIALTARDRDARHWFTAEPVPFSGGGLLTLCSSLKHEPTPREPTHVSDPQPTPTPSPPGSAELPVTLVVELGRLGLSIARLAELKPGDILELGRHAREPVELTSGGRLVARGELVQIDTELGVRLTTVLL